MRWNGTFDRVARWVTLLLLLASNAGLAQERLDLHSLARVLLDRLLQAVDAYTA